MTDIVVHAYEWVIHEIDNVTNIYAWTLNRQSQPTLLRIDDYLPSCYLELPLLINNRPVRWTRDHIHTIIEALNDKLDESMQIESWEYVLKQKIYYYCEATWPMLRIEMATPSAIKAFAKKLQYHSLYVSDIGHLQLTVHESQIGTIRKMLTQIQLQYAQWMRIHAVAVPPKDKVSLLEEEYIISWKDITPISSEESRGWTTQPSILAIDIECYSPNHRAMPNKFLVNNDAYMISCIYTKFASTERKRYGVVIGPCDTIPTHVLDNCQVISVQSEYQLVEAFADIVRKTNPDILTGYNILGFDYPYLHERLQKRNQDWPNMSRLIGGSTTLTTMSWKSGAYGHNDINNLQMEGRISIDMLPIVRRDHKLDKYDLNTVSSYFLGKQKHDITAIEMFHIYEQVLNAITPEQKQAASAQMSRVMAYCIQDSELVLELMNKLNTWYSLVELSNIVGVTIVELFTRGQQMRCLSQIYNLAAQENYVLDHREDLVGKFKGGFVFEPQPGVYENVICLDFASLYPSIIIALNMCYTTLIHPKHHIEVSSEDCNTIECECEEDDKDDDEEEDDSDEEYEVQTQSKSKTKPKMVKVFVNKFHKGKVGILPRLVGNLISERKAVRASIKGEKDPVIKAILDARQLALKVSANSMFGFLGVRNGGLLPLPEGAMSITATGRQLISKVQEYLEQTYEGKMVYGDTDSVMVSLDKYITDRTQCQYWGERLSQEISGYEVGDALPGGGGVHEEKRPGLFPPPLRMEFEKAMRLFCIKKKKYAALLIDKRGNFKKLPLRDANGKIVGESEDYDMLKKGIVLARRDNCKFQRKTYMDILQIIMKRESLESALTVIFTAIKKLLAGEVVPEELTIIRQLGAQYKSENYFMNLFKKNLKVRGKSVAAGDRLEYLITKITLTDSVDVKLGDKMYLKEEYEEDIAAGREPPTIDYFYYVNNILANCINQLFEIGFSDDLKNMRNISYQATNRHKVLYLTEPVSIIAHIISRNPGSEIMMLDYTLNQWLTVIDKIRHPKITINIVPKTSDTHPIIVRSPSLSLRTDDIRKIPINLIKPYIGPASR